LKGWFVSKESAPHIERWARVLSKYFDEFQIIIDNEDAKVGKRKLRVKNLIHDVCFPMKVILMHCRLIRSESAAPQQTSVNSGMQGLDATVHDFRKAGVGADFGDFDASVLQRQERMVE